MEESDSNMLARKIIADALEIDLKQVEPTASIEVMLEWDSLRHISVVTCLQQVLGRELEIEEILGATSIEGIDQILKASERSV